MAQDYYFRAKNAKGEVFKGSMKADSKLAVAEYLNSQDYYIIKIEEKKDIDLKKILNLFNGIKPKELAVLSRQLAVLINAGVPIIQCLDILVSQVENKFLNRGLQEIYKDVESGLSFSGALEKHPEIFPPLYFKMVYAGEAGGFLDVVIRRLADYYERENELNSKVRTALTYPFVVILFSILVIIFLMVVVIPVFVELFSNMGSSLPLPTQMVIKVSNIFTQYWYLLFIFTLAFLVLIKSYLDSPKGSYNFHRLQLKIPVIGKLIIKKEVARITRTLSNLLKSGIPIIEALGVVENIITNQVIAGRLTEARMRIREGVRLSEPLKKSGIFPKMMIEMVVVGEETGTMDEMFEKIAHFYDKEVENTIQAAMTLIEPLLIVTLALIIGFIVIAIALPMFDMMNLF